MNMPRLIDASLPGAPLDSYSISELVQMSLGTNKGSWWAGPDFGSELHRIDKVDGNTASIFKGYCVAALQWLLDDGLAASIQVEAERRGRSGIGYRIEVSRPGGETELLEELWQV